MPRLMRVEESEVTQKRKKLLTPMKKIDGLASLLGISIALSISCREYPLDSGRKVWNVACIHP
jgi:hypothetical protein